MTSTKDSSSSLQVIKILQSNVFFFFSHRELLKHNLPKQDRTNTCASELLLARVSLLGRGGTLGDSGNSCRHSSSSSKDGSRPSLRLSDGGVISSCEITSQPEWPELTANIEK